jgi:hypothetical protein
MTVNFAQDWTMSSATSIKKGRVPLPAPPDYAAAAADGGGDAGANAGFRPWQFFVLASLIAATGAVILSTQSTPEHLILISLTIASAGIAAAGFYRMLSPLAAPDVSSLDEPLSGRSRAILEREKRLTMRSIKELEFDRAMGKVSQKDFDEMSGRLRARAMTLMQQLEEGAAGYRPEIERQLQAKLAQRVGSAPPAAILAPACAGCGTVNDADAAFCKRCGRKIDVIERAEAER